MSRVGAGVGVALRTNESIDLGLSKCFYLVLRAATLSIGTNVGLHLEQMADGEARSRILHGPTKNFGYL